MPSLFGGKKKPTSSNAAGSAHQSNPSSPVPASPQSSPDKDKKSRGYFVRDRGKDRRPPSPRSSKSFTRSSTSRRTSDSSHPLNLPPDELRRLSAAMSSSPSSERDGGVAVPVSDPMETTPAPESVPPGAAANGVNREHENGSNDGPAPPPHRTPASPPPPPEIRHEDAEAFKAAGNKLYKAGQYGSAIDQYTKAVEANPTSSTYLSNRAAAYMSNGQYVQALEDCKLADELEPDNARILHRLAKVYTSLGRPREALGVYDSIQPSASAKDREPAVQMQRHLDQAQESLQNGTSGSMVNYAMDQAERGLASSVQPPRKWRLMRGEAYLKMSTVNSLGDAQNVAMSLLRANPADPEALVLRGRALYAQGENEKAIQHFRQAISCDPDYQEAVKYLRLVQKLDKMKDEGNAHFKLGRYQQAIDVYTTALEVDPLNKGTNSKILNNRAMCYSRKKQYDMAVQDCDKAITLDPSYTKARKTRAKALGEGGDWEEAVRAYKSIQETSPEEPGIAKEIRQAELELKKSKRKDYYKILGIDKDAQETDVKRAYRKLAVVHHPDKNPGDPTAEERFKDIQEAHETLIDPQKRERYDSGVDLMEPGEGFGGGFGGMGGMGGGMGGGMQIDPEMLFNMMGGGGRGGGGGGGFQFAGGSPFGGMGGQRGGFGGHSPFG